MSSTDFNKIRRATFWRNVLQMSNYPHWRHTARIERSLCDDVCGCDRTKNLAQWQSRRRYRSKVKISSTGYHFELLAPTSNFVHWCGYWLRIKNYAGMRRISENIIHLGNFTLDLHNELSSENVKWYFRDAWYSGWPIVRQHPEQICFSSRHGFASLWSAHSNYVQCVVQLAL